MSKKVSYFYHEDLGYYHYGNTHPMKPHRIRMTDSLIRAYNLLDKMTPLVPRSLITPRRSSIPHSTRRWTLRSFTLTTTFYSCRISHPITKPAMPIS